MKTIVFRLVVDDEEDPDVVDLVCDMIDDITGRVDNIVLIGPFVNESTRYETRAFEPGV